MADDLRERLAALVTKWRDRGEAAFAHSRAHPSESGEWRCAADLEAALAAPASAETPPPAPAARKVECPWCLNDFTLGEEPCRAPVHETSAHDTGDHSLCPAPATATRTETVWVPEHPRIRLYRARVPAAVGKLGEQLDLTTASIHDALQFPTREECEAWIAANPHPVFVAREHMVAPPAPADLDATLRAVGLRGPFLDAARDLVETRITEAAERLARPAPSPSLPRGDATHSDSCIGRVHDSLGCSCGAVPEETPDA